MRRDVLLYAFGCCKQDARRGPGRGNSTALKRLAAVNLGFRFVTPSGKAADNDSIRLIYPNLLERRLVACSRWNVRTSTLERWRNSSAGFCLRGFTVVPGSRASVCAVESASSKESPDEGS